MPKLTVLRGLPASGKSTLAEEVLIATGNTVRVNKDLLRTMLHFDKFTGKNEDVTFSTEVAIAKINLLQGINVVVDDTNLNPRVQNEWAKLAEECDVKIETVKVKATLEECIARDRLRDKKVGSDVITKMAMQYGMYPEPKKGFVICDLDGTLCDITHRLPYVKNIPEGGKKDWKSFFEGIKDDKPRIDVIDMVMNYEGEGYDIFFVSGRPENYREATEIWLEKCFLGYFPHKGLIMRSSHDKRPDTEVKQDILNKYFEGGKKVYKVIDDRPSVIRMWKENGLDVIDVGKGVEF